MDRAEQIVEVLVDAFADLIDAKRVLAKAAARIAPAVPSACSTVFCVERAGGRECSACLLAGIG